MNTEINLWGVLLLVLLVVAAGALFWLADRRVLRLVLRSGGLLLLQLLFVGGYVWGLMLLDRWWIDVLWLLLMAVVTAQFVDYPTGADQRSLRLAHQATLLALICGGGLMSGVLMLCFRGHWFVPVVGVLMGHLLVSTSYLLKACDSSLRHTGDHRRFLLANGATRFEVLLPTARRALHAALVPLMRQWSSPLLVAMPLLFCGMLMGGASLLTSLVVVLLLALALFASTVLTGVLVLFLLEKLK